MVITFVNSPKSINKEILIFKYIKSALVSVILNSVVDFCPIKSQRIEWALKVRLILGHANFA